MKHSIFGASHPTTTRYPAALHGLASDAGPDGVRVFWTDPAQTQCDLLKAQTDFAAPTIETSQTLLKNARQRFVFRHVLGKKSYVFKLFPLQFLPSRLKHPKYAYHEFSNMRLAADRGVPTPFPIAFLEKRRHGLVSCSGLIQQDLVGFSDLHAAARDKTLSNDKIMDHASAAMCLMYDTGANHIDLRDENIMINLETAEWQIIDWQYASFVAPRAPWLLEYLVAYYIRLAPKDWRARLTSKWIPQVHSRSGHPDPLDLFTQRIAALGGRRNKVKHRLALHPVAI